MPLYYSSSTQQHVILQNINLLLFLYTFHQVQENDCGGDGEILVKFMKRFGTLYQWPEQDDIGYQPAEDIICVLSPPTVAKFTSSRSQFRFLESEIQKIRSKFTKTIINFK